MRRAVSSRVYKISTAAFLVALTVSGVPAHAQDMTSREGIALQNQIQQLSQQLNQLQANGGGLGSAPVAASPANSGGQSGDLTAQLLERVASLEAQNREMRGELDQLTNQVQTQTATLSKKISDMEFAQQNGGGGGAPSGDAGASSAPRAPSAPASAKAASAVDMLKTGQDALRSKDYAAAQESAEGALKIAKSTNGRMDAQFLLAQSLAGQKQYKNSAVAYYDAYNRAPKSPRAQEALLGVSASMLALGDKSSACEALHKLQSEFPQPAPRVKSAAASFRSRAACH